MHEDYDVWRVYSSITGKLILSYYFGTKRYRSSAPDAVFVKVDGWQAVLPVAIKLNKEMRL